MFSHNWDWNFVVENRGRWICPHCRGTCPERAQCAIYRRTNERRREQQLIQRSWRGTTPTPNATSTGGNGERAMTTAHQHQHGHEHEQQRHLHHQPYQNQHQHQHHHPHQAQLNLMDQHRVPSVFGEQVMEQEQHRVDRRATRGNAVHYSAGN